jgi:hypothetical protein
MKTSILDAERQYLSGLLEAIQRCVYFLHASDSKIAWPLDGEILRCRKKDQALFESLAAINERFAKLQDTLAAAMRHAALLMGESTDSFLKVLSFYEKKGGIESISTWQVCRTSRNLAAHDYETDYALIAEHFNTLHDLRITLYQAAARFMKAVREIDIQAANHDFSDEFYKIVETD